MLKETLLCKRASRSGAFGELSARASEAIVHCMNSEVQTGLRQGPSICYISLVKPIEEGGSNSPKACALEKASGKPQAFGSKRDRSSSQPNVVYLHCLFKSSWHFACSQARGPRAWKSGARLFTSSEHFLGPLLRALEGYGWQRTVRSSRQHAVKLIVKSPPAYPGCSLTGLCLWRTWTRTPSRPARMSQQLRALTVWG